MIIFTKKIESVIKFSLVSQRRKYVNKIVRVDAEVVAIKANGTNNDRFMVTFRPLSDVTVVSSVEGGKLLKVSKVTGLVDRDHFNVFEIIAAYQTAWDNFATMLKVGEKVSVTGVLYLYDRNGDTRWSIDATEVSPIS